MVNLIGALIAGGAAAYTLIYACYVWRDERNHAGALASAVLAAATVGLPIYMLYFRR